MRRWPLFLIAAPAAVAIWSGWVGLGELCGFGVVHPLPGIWPALQLNTAITLPVGVEAYGAYALGAWLRSPRRTRPGTFARRSAIGALVLGMLGQVVYHLLAAAHAHPGAVAGRRARVVPAGGDARLRRRADAPAARGRSERLARETLPLKPRTRSRIRRRAAPERSRRPRRERSPGRSAGRGPELSAVSALNCTSASREPRRYARYLERTP